MFVSYQNITKCHPKASKIYQKGSLDQAALIFHWKKLHQFSLEMMEFYMEHLSIKEGEFIVLLSVKFSLRRLVFFAAGEKTHTSLGAFLEGYGFQKGKIRPQ